MFLVQHYSHRVQHIFLKSGATVDEYHKALQHFDKRAGHHYTEVNRRTIDYTITNTSISTARPRSTTSRPI
eukprot:2376019-Amphidinium_carterae.1